MPELGKAYVQIIPSAQGIKNNIAKTIGGDAPEAGRSIGSKIAKFAAKAFVAAEVGKTIMQSVRAGAAREQAVGGIETLFKSSANKVIKYANEAFKTAGVSANAYMENVTSFSASLLQSLGGNTSKAAEVANMAMIDMADNMNKMGTPLQSIQDAYQGFAKQNYTMLDNLKLGYGGTKTEMERLLADAQKLTGVKYDINNLSDVYSAIHAIQKELDITGTTAKEAATTLSGSFGSMKAAWQNLMAEISTGGDIKTAITNLLPTIGTFAQNALGMLWNIVKAIPQVAYELIVQGLPQLITSGRELINGLIQGVINSWPNWLAKAREIIPALAKQVVAKLQSLSDIGADIIVNIINGIGEMYPTLVTTIQELLPNAIKYLTENLSALASKASEILGKIVTAIMDNFPTMLETLLQGLQSMVTEVLPTLMSIGESLLFGIMDGINNNWEAWFEKITEIISVLWDAIAEAVPNLINCGIEIITNLISGIAEKLPDFLATIGNLLSSALSYIVEKLPSFLAKGGEIIGKIAAGILENLPTILKAIGKIILSLISYIITNLPEFLAKGIALIASLASGIVQAIGNVLSAIGEVILGALEKVGSFFNSMLEKGKGLISKVGEGISNAASKVWDAVKNCVKSAVDKVGNFLNDMIEAGKNLIMGIGQGIWDGAKWVYDQITGFCNSVLDQVKSFFGIFSPSRVFAGIGSNLDAGLAKGIVDNLDVVDSAMDEMENAAMRELTPNMDFTTSAIPDLPQKQTDASANQPINLVLNLGGQHFRAFVDSISDLQNSDMQLQLEYAGGGM